MYVAPTYAEADPAKIREIIRTYSFATVVTCGSEEPAATHVPLHFEQDDAGAECLYGHVSKANPQWRHFGAHRSAMAVFQGPHHYVSPSWYDHMNVPTWNYIAVHVYGRTLLVTDPQELRSMFTRLIETHETSLGSGYSIESMTPAYYTKELKGLVAFKICIDRIEANFKLSQNRHDRDHANIRKQLNALGTENAVEIARWMGRNRP